MSEESADLLNLVSEDGIAAKHPSSEVYSVLVGSATESEYNTIKPAMIPFACWRADDLRFEFDSSLVRPGIEAEMKNLASLRKAHPNCPLSFWATPTPREMTNTTNN